MTMTFLEILRRRRDGARSGSARAGKCVFANDVDPKKRDGVYIRNFGRDHFLLRDIKDVTIDDLPPGRVDCAWMSPPCVGHSEAGNRKGFDEKQSRAFWPCSDSIQALDTAGRAPLTVAFENVAGIKPGEPSRDAGGVRALPLPVRNPDRRRSAFRRKAERRHLVVGAHRDLGVDPGTIVRASDEDAASAQHRSHRHS